MRDRATADFLRPDYKGSADHLDKAAVFYPSLAPPGFDVPPLSLDSGGGEPRSTRPPSHMTSQASGVPASTMAGHPPITTTTVSHPSIPQPPQNHDSDNEKKNNIKLEAERKNKGM